MKTPKNPKDYTTYYTELGKMFTGTPKNTLKMFLEDCEMDAVKAFRHAVGELGGEVDKDRNLH
jgi:hypothetical protein